VYSFSAGLNHEGVVLALQQQVDELLLTVNGFMVYETLNEVVGGVNPSNHEQSPESG